MYMSISKTRDSLLLFLGDIIFFGIALWFSIFVRYIEVPSKSLFFRHLVAFSFVFLIWALVFFVFNLYGKQSIIFRNKLPALILRAQIVNSIIAAIYFYFLPNFGITPKTILLLDLVFSFALIFSWRWYVTTIVYKGRHERALIIGDDEDVLELKSELSANPGYHVEVANTDKDILPDTKNISSEIEKADVTMIILNFKDKRIETVASDLYKLFFTRVRFIEFQSLYEEVFDRVPLSLLNDQWMLENLTRRTRRGYAILKRAMDLAISTVLLAVSSPIFLIVAIVIKVTDGGSIIFAQERVGKDGKKFMLHKFRTMTENAPQTPTLLNDPRITKVGTLLRKSRVDELPQLWDVILGNLSLVGPRPELPKYVEQYAKEVPFYEARHIITPGSSGWAQIHYHTPAYSAATNAVKLSYELYYIKNRSTPLDLKIALRTIHTLLSRKGI